MRLSGYLVVLRRPEDIVNSPNPSYRGLYRTPPWSQSAFEAGFDDPYTFGDLVTDEGFFPDEAAAGNALRQFAPLWPPEDLEIIWTRQLTAARNSRRNTSHSRIGFDLACQAPFWSPLVDRVPSGQRVRELRANLNDAGLIDDACEAFALLDEVRAKRLIEPGIDLFVWEVADVQPRAGEHRTGR